MREQLKIYLDSVFASAASTKKNNELREEILANLYDKYDGYVAVGASPEEAYRKTIAGIGDLSSLFEQMEQKDATDPKPLARAALESEKQSEAYPAIRALLLSCAIFLYILSVVPVIVWESIFATVSMFLMIALATGMILSLSLFRVHTVPATLDDTARRKHKRVHTTATLILSAAVMGYILCICPILILENAVGVALFFVMIALSTVALIVRTTLFGTVLATIDNEESPMNNPSGDSTKKQKKNAQPKTLADKIFSVASGAYWLVVVCVYFVFSILTNRWSTSWMIFILALLFHGIVHGIFRLVSRKGTAGPIVKIVICSILFVTLLPIGVGFSLSELPYLSLNLETYDDSTYEFGNATLTDTDIHTLDVEWISGSVTVRHHEGDQIVIRECDHTTKANITVLNDQLRYRVEDGKITIKQESPVVGIFFGTKDKAKDLEVLLPATVSLTEFNLDNVSAEVTLTDLRDCRTIDVETVSGNVTLNACTATEMSLSGVSGTLRLNACETAEWDMETVSGAVYADFIHTPTGMDMETVSGSVHLTLPADLAGFTLNFDAVSGHTEIGYPCEQTGNRFHYGNGTARIDFDAVSGNLVLKPAA